MAKIAHIAVLGIVQDIELNIEKFFEFKAILRSLQFVVVFGKMYGPQGSGKGINLCFAIISGVSVSATSFSIN